MDILKGKVLYIMAFMHTSTRQNSCLDVLEEVVCVECNKCYSKHKNNFLY